MKRLAVVFCGSSSQILPEYLGLADRVGPLLGRLKLGLVFGAGTNGMMGRVARSAFDQGVPITGIIPSFLKELEPTPDYPIELIETPDMQTRKRLLLDLSNGCLVLPGGFGTMDELFEVLTGSQLGVYSRPIYILNHLDYFRGLRIQFETMQANGFVKSEAFAKTVWLNSFEELETALEQFAWQVDLDPEPGVQSEPAAEPALARS